MKNTLDSKKLLLPHIMVLFALSIVLQAVIVARGNHIDEVANALLGVVFAYYVYFHITSANQLRKIRFGRLVAHLAAFIIINTSYHLHAFSLMLANNDAIRGDQDFPINPGWFGVLFGMATFWGIGLVAHTIASVANRGYEEL